MSVKYNFGSYEKVNKKLSSKVKYLKKFEILWVKFYV